MYVDEFVRQIRECRTTTELAIVVVRSVKDGNGPTPHDMVKEKFINLLLPFTTNIHKGLSIINIRQRINDAWENRSKSDRHTIGGV